MRDGIIAAGGTAIEIPVHPIQETGKRPTAMLDRNLAYLSLVETLFGYPIDGVVLNIGCDKTTPALLMAAATVNIPAIGLSVGPMLNGWFNRTAYWIRDHRVRRANFWLQVKLTKTFLWNLWQARNLLWVLQHHGNSDNDEFSGRSPGCSFRARQPSPRPTAKEGRSAMKPLRIVDMVWEDLRPSDIMTRAAFENAVINSAIGGSTNAPIHLNGTARHWGDAGQ